MPSARTIEARNGKYYKSNAESIRSSEPLVNNIVLIQSPKTEPLVSNIRLIQSAKGEPPVSNIGLIQSAKGEPLVSNLGLIQSPKGEPLVSNIVLIQSPKREPLVSNIIIILEKQGCRIVSRSQTVTLAVTVRTTAVERFVCSHLSPTLLPGELRTKRSAAVVQTVTASVRVWLRETSCRKCTPGSQL